MRLGRVFEGKAWDGRRQALEEEEGRTEEMVGSAREGLGNFQDKLEKVQQGKGMTLEGKRWALTEIGRVREVEGRA